MRWAEAGLLQGPVRVRGSSVTKAGWQTGYRAMKQAPVMETALKPTVLVEVSICLLLPNYVCYFEYQSCKSEGKSPVFQHLAVSILVSLSLWFWEPGTVQQCPEPIPP